MGDEIKLSQPKNIALIVVFASLYAVIGYVLHPISFVEIQVRVSDALYPLIAVFGFPSLVGLTIGHFLLNLSSPLGLLDLLSVLLFVPAKLAIWKWGLKAVPLHILSIALWVPFMLNHLFGVPFWITVVFVGIGEIIAEIVLGVPLTLGIQAHVVKTKNPEATLSRKGVE